MKEKELNINNYYLRENHEKFSLAPKGQEKDIENGKCNFYTDVLENVDKKYIVYSYSVGDFESTINRMICNSENVAYKREKGASTNYVIREDGGVYHLVSDNKKPWAFGVGDLRTGSKLNPNIENDMHNNMNNYGIGVMFINDGKSYITEQQSEVNQLLIKSLLETNKIDPQNVIGLGDWAPGRHIAPGAYFHTEWNIMGQKGIGFWPKKVEYKKDPQQLFSFCKKNDPLEVEDYSGPFKELYEKRTLNELTNYKDINDAINSLGMVGMINEKDNLKPEESRLLSSMVGFNMHYQGYTMVEGGLLASAYDVLWHDSSDPDAREVIGGWNRNSQLLIEGILDQY